MIPALPKGSLGHLRNAERSYAKLRRYGVRGNGHAPPEYDEARAAFLAELRALAALSPSLLNEAPAFAALVVPDVGRLDRVVACGVAKGDLCSLVDWAHRTLNLMPRPARRC